MLSISDLKIAGKKLLMRVDFNVPLDSEGRVTDETRIREALPSIEYALKQGGSVILMSHMGRPKERRDPKLSLAPCVPILSRLLERPVKFAKDCIGENAKNLAKNLKAGEVLLLENLRFYPAEEKPDLDPTFAKQLSELGDLFVNDAFGAAHRAHSSTYTIVSYFPGRAAAGFLMQKELSFLEPLLKNPKAPFYAIIGGAKISSKIGVLKTLLDRADALFIGGAMAYTFFKAQGISIGKSLCEEKFIPMARELMERAKKEKKPLFLPTDLLIAEKAESGAKTKTILTREGIPEGWEGVDIGPETIKNWVNELHKAQTIFWNGPVGIFEIPEFAKGTNSLARDLASLKSIRIIGGGDSVSAINQLGLSKNFTHLSTGGGATLELLEFGTLPGIEILKNKK
ncbi:MAG: phosphoglycerate kinase [Chlamydiales bacterium]|nr:phosphoglycerate kinase [Chlamydiales bacterium]